MSGGSVSKTGPVLGVTAELFADNVFNIGRSLRGSTLFLFADMDGRVEYRGSGWWRLDGGTLRGRHAVREELMRLADNPGEEQ